MWIKLYFQTRGYSIHQQIVYQLIQTHCVVRFVNIQLYQTGAHYERKVLLMSCQVMHVCVRLVKVHVRNSSPFVQTLLQ